MSKDKLYTFLYEHAEDFRNGVDDENIHNIPIGCNHKFIRKELNKLCYVRKKDSEKKTNEYFLREESGEFLTEFYNFAQRQKLRGSIEKRKKNSNTNSKIEKENRNN